MPGSRLGCDENRTHINRPDVVRILRCQFLQRPADKDPGVVDQDVDPAEFRYGLLHGRGDGAGIGAVGLDHQRQAASGINLLRDRTRVLDSIHVRERHRRTIVGQTPRDRSTDPAAPARHQRHLARELFHLMHSRSSASPLPSSGPRATPLCCH